MKRKHLSKPLLKWVGGKTQLLDRLMPKFPTKMKNYHEIFTGGGSVLLRVLEMKQKGLITIEKNIYAYDINEGLIHFYKNIQNKKDELYSCIEHYKRQYHFIQDMNIDVDETDAKERRKRLKVLRNPQEKTTTSREAYYYWLRNKFNGLDKQSVEYSALFLILNKTGFRGLFRESSNGFNVPFGNYKTVNVITKERLNEIHDMIKDVTFVCCDFTESMKRIQEGDFVYLDPPYAPENEHSFVGYNQDGFGNHETLFEYIKKQPAKFVMSNANVKLVIDKFKEYTIDVVEAKRAINSKKPGAKTLEVIINN
jgi:DNA adenine methylase